MNSKASSFILRMNFNAAKALESFWAAPWALERQKAAENGEEGKCFSSVACELQAAADWIFRHTRFDICGQEQVCSPMLEAMI